MYHANTEISASQQVFSQEMGDCYTTAFRLSPAAMAISRLADGLFIDVNDCFAQMVGYQRDALIGHTTTATQLFTDPTERGRIMEALRDKESLQDQEIILNTATNEQRCFIWSTQRITIADQPCLLTTISDIAKHTQGAASQAQLATIVETSHVAIFSKTLDGVITSWNYGAELLYGYTAVEAIGQPITLIMPPHNQNELTSLMEHVARGEHITEYETTRMRKDGCRIAVSVTIAPIHAGDGQRTVVGAAIVARDITQRLATVEALHESEARFRATFEQAAIGIAQISLDGRWLRINPQICAILGRAVAELIQTDCQMVVHPADQDTLRDYLRESQMGRRDTWSFELRYLHKDGAIVWVDFAASLIRDGAGNPAYVIAVVADISVRKAAEATLMQVNTDLEQRVVMRTVELATANEQLIAINRELESFAYAVSHDLRTPLRSMSGFSEILLKSYSTVLDEKGRHYLERVWAGSQQMARLIDELLALSRLTRSEMHRETVDLTALAHEVADGLQQTEPSRSVTWVIAAGLTAYGDSGLLRIILDNLLGNAWKFTGQHQVAHIEVGMRLEAAEAVYFVKDDGAGFDMAYADKLFSAFQRLHTTREFEGTGIGLATVRRIILRHGGRVWAEGKVEQGATISFTLMTGKEAEDANRK